MKLSHGLLSAALAFALPAVYSVPQSTSPAHHATHATAMPVEDLTLDADEDRVVLQTSQDVMLDHTSPAETGETIPVTVEGRAAVVKIPAQGLLAMEAPTLVTVTDGVDITLVWEEFDDLSSSYRVLRDGEFLDTVTGQSWTDHDAHPTDTHQYEVQAEVTDLGDQAFDEPAQPVRGTEPIEVDPPAEEELSEEELQHNVGTLEENSAGWGPDWDQQPVDAQSPRADTEPSAVPEGPFTRSVGTTASKNMANAAPTTSRTGTSSTFRYNTFIPNKSASALACPLAVLAGGQQFGGDNRSWHPDGSVRTRVEVKTPWSSSNPMTYSRRVSDTRVYDGSGKYLEKKNAGTSGIRVSQMFRNSSFTHFHINHKVRNPYCPAGDITYNIDVAMTSMGDYTIAGNHRKAPNHEAYVRHSKQSVWYGIYHRQLQDFNCLISDLHCGGLATFHNQGVSIP